MTARITDGQARRIASDWHGGQWSPLYMLASTGATKDSRYRLSDVVVAIQRELLPERLAESERLFPGAGRDLRALLAYVRAAGARGPVPGWSDLWGDSLVA